MSTDRQGASIKASDETRRKGRAAPAAAERDAQSAVEEAGQGNLDKVRDILFGSNMRSYEERLAQLEARLLEESAELRDSTKAKQEHLESVLRTELTALADRMTAEQTERAAELKVLADKLAVTTEAFEQRVRELDGRVSTSGQDLGAQILAQTETLTAQLRQASEEITSRLDDEVRELRATKTDTASLAVLFAELAGRLDDGLPRPRAK